uniref:Nucleoprotein n=1 Tax=Tataguine virus TaxID=1623310 RepID=A0A2C9DTC8_9VIRU|nr:nucleocapsid protein [Tataguine virus]QLA46884.1 N [Tataguine virus] [Tataguine virus]
MANPDFTFDDSERLNIEPFRPDVAYTTFDLMHKPIIKDIRIFFLNAGKLKKKLTAYPKAEITVKFGDWTVTVKNTHNPALGTIKLAETDLTLHRISGFLALKLLKLYSYGQNDQAELIRAEVVNPIAESQGVTWQNSNVDMYLSFFPGTEFFLTEFRMYPLAIGLVRVKKNLMKPDFLVKMLRQKYDGKDPAKWMVEDIGKVTAAVNEVSKHPLIKMNLVPHIKTFLTQMGIGTGGLLL